MKLVAQDFNLNQFSKVYDNIAGMLSNIDLQAKRRKTLEVMEFLRIDHLAGKRAADLSGGEQQRVAIARAVITDPTVLLLDEPFSQVDALLKNQLRADIKRLAEFMGITVILVSHDPADGLSLADKMIILKEGKILESGPPEQLYNNPRHLHTARLLSNCNVLTADEALLAGIVSEKDTVVIYPEWIETGEGKENIFQVRDLFFKGFYSELLLKKEYLQLRALNIRTNHYKRGDRLSVVIRKYLEFDH
jgi:ABC-type sugar transport system ATPase subunit